MPGEIAEMMLDGFLCEGCGEYLGEDAGGYPRRCAGCRQDDAGDHQIAQRLAGFTRRQARRANNEPSYCPICGKRKDGPPLAAHMRDAHRLRLSCAPVGRAMVESDL